MMVPNRKSIEALLDTGMAAIDAELQQEFETGCATPARITQLNGLRSQYVFDRMRIVRAGIAASDGSAEQVAASRALEEACEALGRLQDNAAKANAWIDQASDALAKVASLAGRLAV